MTSPLLAELEARRARLFERLAAVGDFRRGSVSENWRRCGKPSCRRCAEPGSRGHGPRWLWTRTVPGRGTIGRQLRPEELGKVRAELENYQQFAALAEADRGGERGDLRGPARPRQAPDGPLTRRGKKRALRSARHAARGGGRRGGRAAGRSRRPRRWPAGRAWSGQSWRSGPRYGTGARGAGAAAGRRSRLPRPARWVRRGPPGGVRVLPGQDHGHRARPGHAAPGVVSLRGLRARVRAPRCRAGGGRADHVAGAAAR